MAPRRKRAVAAADSPADSAISTSASGAVAPTVADAPRRRRRGRPAKPKAPAVSAESVSSAPSVALSGSDNGEDYSTAATSNVVTPVPSTSTNQPKPTRGRPARLVNRAARPIVELPDDIDDDQVDKPRAFRSRAKRTQQPDDNSDGGEYFDPSPDAVLARRLQREEDAKAVAGSSTQALFEAPRDSRRRSTRLNRVATQDDDDNEEDPLLLQQPQVNGNGKGKGKASIAAATRKRKALISSVDGAYDDDDDIAGQVEDGNDGDVELSFTIPARKKVKQSAPADDGSELTLSDGSPFDPFEFDGEYGSGYISLDSDNDEQGLDGYEDADSDGSASRGPDDNRAELRRIARSRRGFRDVSSKSRAKKDRDTLERHHPELKTMWDSLRDIPILKEGRAEQPGSISRQLKPFQLEGLAWMKKMENIQWRGGVLGDEMGLGKTIQAVSLIMSDYPAKNPSLVLVPPVALMQWMAEIESYTDGTLKTLVFHGTNSKAKNMAAKDLRKYDVLIMSYNTLESIYRKQEKGFRRKAGLFKEKSPIHSIKFHRVILDEAHCVKVSTAVSTLHYEPP
jgi:DNA repair protein RAD16